MQDSDLSLVQMYKPETLLASVEVCRDLASCVLLYKAFLNSIIVMFVFVAGSDGVNKNSISL